MRFLFGRIEMLVVLAHKLSLVVCLIHERNDNALVTVRMMQPISGGLVGLICGLPWHG